MNTASGETRPEPFEAAAPSSYLEVLDGPAVGARQPLGPRLVIGRSSRCDLVLAGQLVSRTHAEVVLEDGDFVLRDLGSVNGTSVNGHLTTRAVLRHGDRVGVGDTTLRVQLQGGRSQRDPTDSHVVLCATAPREEPRARLQGEASALQASLRSTDTARAQRAQLRLDALVSVTQNLTRLRELAVLYPLVVDEVMRVLPAERAALLRVGADGQLHPEVARNRSDPGGAVEVSRTVVEEVSTHRQCVLSADALLDERISVSESIMLHNIRSVLCVPIAYDEELLGVLYLDAPGRENLFTEEDLHFVSGIAGIAAVAITNAMALERVRSTAQELNRAYLSMLSVLANAIEARDHYTIGHTWRVARFAQVIARRLGWLEERVGELEVGGVLHDIGKIGVPDSILTKPGPLTAPEQQLMELHPQIGAKMLRDVPTLQRILPYVLHHHERWDGTGYPDRLKAEAIPDEARLLAVADALDAMTSSRPYRPGLEREVAIDELERQAGRQFDPDVVAAATLAYHQGELDAFLQVAPDDPRDILCPYCSSCCTVEPGVTEIGRMTCPVCSRRLLLKRAGDRISAELE
jgi:putative nucleotidyltransferase with HDIG domain